MFRGTVGKLSGWLAALVVAGGLLSPTLARAQNPGVGGGAPCASCAQQPSISYGSGCCRQLCCPTYRHCSEGAICIKFHCGCPKPVCNPCDLQNYGYTQTCWSPWPFPPNWSHCPVPPATVFAGPAVNPPTNRAPIAAIAPRSGGAAPVDSIDVLPAVPNGIRPGL